MPHTKAALNEFIVTVNVAYLPIAFVSDGCIVRSKHVASVNRLENVSVRKNEVACVFELGNVSVKRDVDVGAWAPGPTFAFKATMHVAFTCQTVHYSPSSLSHGILATFHDVMHCPGLRSQLLNKG